MWIAIVGLTLVTIVTRSAFLIIGQRFALPPRWQHALRFAPACALTALIAPELLSVQDIASLSLTNPRLIAGAVAAAVMAITRSTIATIAIAMSVFELLSM